ncbi:hypothetical protein JCM8115_004089 [Rhodotorula mucilaginosa]
MPSRRSSEHKPQYTPPALFFELEHEFKAVARQATSSKSQPVHKPRAPRNNARSCSPEPVLQGNIDEEDKVDMLASDDDLNDLDLQLLALAKDDNTKRRRKKRARTKARQAGAGDNNKKRMSLSDLPKEVLKTIAANLSLDGLHALSSTSRTFSMLLQPHKNVELWQDALDALEELPDQSEAELTYSQIAELLYGRTCADCGRRTGRWADWVLRRRLCGRCRSKCVVKFSTLDNKSSGLHSAAEQCVLNSRHSNTSRGLSTVTKNRKYFLSHFGYLPDLERQSDILWTLEEKDQHDEAVAFAQGLPPSTPSSNPKASPHQARRLTSSNYRWDRPRAEGEYGKRVTKHVRRRRAMLEPFEAYALDMHTAVAALYAREDAEMPSQVLTTARRQALERRVLEDTDFEQRDFHGAWLTDPLVNKGTSTISDDDWIRLKPKVSKILTGVREAKALRDLREQQAQRRDTLREFYRKYRDGQTPAAANSMPLFADFALLPAVRDLWEPHDAVASQATWNAARETIEEDLNEWRVSLRLHALKSVFVATADIPENEELAVDADEYAPWDDDFFETVQAAFMCDIHGCYRAKHGKEDARPTFFGSLPDLLQHQHAVHADLKLPAAVYDDPNSAPAFRFSLPLEIANSVIAICQEIGLDEAAATPADIDRKLDEDPDAIWQWYNVPVSAEVALRMRAKAGGKRKVRKEKNGWWTKEGPKERDWRKVMRLAES